MALGTHPAWVELLSLMLASLTSDSSPRKWGNTMKFHLDFVWETPFLSLVSPIQAEVTLPKRLERGHGKNKPWDNVRACKGAQCTFRAWDPRAEQSSSESP